MEITTIKEQIKAALEHAEMTQKDFCKKIDMSEQSLIQRMKTGKFTKQELEKMAEAMGCEYKSYFEFPDGWKY